MLSDKKKRWCADYARGHEGAVDAKHKMCEGYHAKHPTFGMMSDKKKRWCVDCARRHEGAVDA
jgi:hypothetical protein